MNYSQRQQDLAVDIPVKSDTFWSRTGFLVFVTVLIITLFGMFILSVEVGSTMAKGASALPDIRVLENWHPNESTRIYDRHGNLVANIHGDEDRVVVPLSDISPNIQRAVMAIEDNRFYHHSGVDIRGTVRALVQNLKKDDVQGGSTITQQLVKNLFLSPERSISRKIAEAVLAVRVEQVYDKNKILEMYLNQVYWGNQAYGIEKAGRRYFKKPARDLSIGESALLAGLLKAPEGLSPFAYPEASRRRQLEVLAKMEEYGYITHEQRLAAGNERITLNSRKPKPSKYPYFVSYVIQELNERFGEDVVRRGGLRVYTTMDDQVQEAAEKALKTGVDGARFAGVTQGALVSIDVETGEIMAMVGGTNFEKNQFNNATQARRAAGSTFKPLVYLTGFRLGLITPETPISDRPIYFNTGVGIWSPHNWDGRYMGAMNIRRALTLSRNTPTVQIGMKVGIDEVINTAKLAGVKSHIDRNFSSLLGSSGFSPLEMTNAYATFARGGIRMEPTAIRRIENSRGEKVKLDDRKPERAFDPEPVSNLVSILVDVVEKGTGRNAILKGRQVAGKTGTTDSVRDIWFMGFTRDMVAGVWMGNEKYVPLHGVFSSNSAKVWHDFAAKYYELKPVPPSDFPPPAPLVRKQEIDPELYAEMQRKKAEEAAKAEQEAEEEDDSVEDMPASSTFQVSPPAGAGAGGSTASSATGGPGNGAASSGRPTPQEAPSPKPAPAPNGNASEPPVP
jgi:penicillin-binding protein 1A